MVVNLKLTQFSGGVGMSRKSETPDPFTCEKCGRVAEYPNIIWLRWKGYLWYQCESCKTDYRFDVGNPQPMKGNRDGNDIQTTG